MRELQVGILFQFSTIMKTFSNEEIDKAYEIFSYSESDIDKVNDYVGMINFLNKDHFEDIEVIKGLSDVIS
jgi:hypothetical protein